jgi:hypothetical protein
MMKDADLPLKF